MTRDFFDKSEWGKEKRFLMVAGTPTPGSAPGGTPPATPSPAPAQTESKSSQAFVETVEELDVESMIATNGSDLSASTIMKRLQHMHQLRTAGKSAELRDFVLKIYGTDTRFSPSITEVTPAVLDDIRTKEMTAAKRLLSQSAQDELDNMGDPARRKDYMDALQELTNSALSGQSVTHKMLKETLSSLNLNGVNTAKKYLALSQQKKELQQKLDLAKTKLATFEADLGDYEEEKKKIDAQQKIWEENLWSFMAPVTSILFKGGVIAATGSTLWGLGKGFWEAAGVKSGGLYKVASGLWGGISAVPKALLSLATFKAGAIATGVGAVGLVYHHSPSIRSVPARVSNWWRNSGKADRISKQSKKLNVDSLEEEIQDAEAKLQQYRTQMENERKSLEKIGTQLQAQLDAETDTAKRRALNTDLENLARVMDLYSISKGEVVDSIHQPVRKNVDIIKAIDALGLNHAEEYYPELVALAEKDHEESVYSKHKELKELIKGPRLERELKKSDKMDLKIISIYLKSHLDNASIAIPTEINSYRTLKKIVTKIKDLPKDLATRKELQDALVASLEKEIDSRP